ncbi:DUF5343 domain-containing protein [Peteryoungia algae]|uniref:DUF5343 domain-containing protein n=1 Tax=Peteryoungia algae TaxID=2919917 RepID=A0ABT0D0W0_9HYPH|nr:DUF5343 domain-containing protein [Rhizobium sp. SSM4.3]MCJ8239057.1 DUF5343 domain-containing protein [Rhizobium sp. SSM4.3]
MAGLPYVTSPGNIDRALNGIKLAAVPERVSQDFVKTILKIPGGSGDQMTSFLKKIGFVNPDGSPTELYKKFRNPSESGAAIASAIKSAYAPLYIRNEFMHELSDDKLVGILVEETGQPHDSNPVKMIAASIKHLKSFANFRAEEKREQLIDVRPEESRKSSSTESNPGSQSIGLNLGYTINLNLPATSDPEVFDAIFKSIRIHLLRADDA